VALLEAGVLQQIGTPDNLYAYPANRLVAACIGVPGMSLLDGELSGGGTGLSLRHGACALPLGPELCKAWAAFRGRPFTVGIRPENVSIGENAQSDAVLTMSVTLRELMGDRSLVTLRRDAWSLTASVGRQARPLQALEEGQAIQVNLDMNRAHLFDGTTG